MKKNMTKLLIISIACAVITIGGFYGCIILDTTSSDSIEVGNRISEMFSAGDVITPFFSIIILSVMLLGFTILFMIIPACALIFVVLLQAISRLFQIGIEKKWKYITSIVLTVISILLQALVCINLAITMFLPVNRILLFLILILNVGCIIIFIKEIANCMRIIKMQENN